MGWGCTLHNLLNVIIFVLISLSSKLRFNLNIGRSLTTDIAVYSNVKERTNKVQLDRSHFHLFNFEYFLKKNPISGLFLIYFRSSQTNRSVVVFWWSACPPSTLTIRVHIFMKPIFFSVNVIWNNKQKVAGVDPFLKFTSNKCS